MSYVVKMRGVIVGRSALERVNFPERTAVGHLRPGIGYDLVQPVFRLYAEAVPDPGAPPRDDEKLDRYRAALERLGLELFSKEGRRIDTSSIHISDYVAERGSQALELEVVTEDAAFWADHGARS
jgi:hypothetical protein